MATAQGRLGQSRRPADLRRKTQLYIYSTAFGPERGRITRHQSALIGAQKPA